MITDNLKGYWKFEEASGNTVTDASGNGFAGTMMNSPTRAVGKFGQGITFADNQNVIDCGTDPIFNLGANDFTINVWVNPVRASANGVSMMVSKGTNSPATGWSWYYYGDGRLCFGAPGIYEHGTSAGTITYNAWQMLTITRIADMVTMYKNGVSVFQLYMPGATIYPNNLPLQLGNITSSLAYAMIGVMDSPAIWVGHGLTASEVTELYLLTDLVPSSSSPAPAPAQQYKDKVQGNDYRIDPYTRDYVLKAGQFALTADIMNNIYLSLAVRKGAWPFAPKFGSKLHLLQRSKATAHTAAVAKEYCDEALKWILDDGRADSINVVTELDRNSNRLNLHVTAAWNGKKITYDSFVEVR
ncbi:hypothetical protein EPN18_06815 [bacterium]|nr:MAG: hypothetical protein EPN18_06815 [bacterium]